MGDIEGLIWLIPELDFKEDRYDPFIPGAAMPFGTWFRGFKYGKASQRAQSRNNFSIATTTTKEQTTLKCHIDRKYSFLLQVTV